MKTPKPKKMYDLCILRKANEVVYFDATLEWNLPYTIARSVLRREMNNPRRELSKGQFLYPVPNGTDPLIYYRQQKEKLKAR